MDVDAHIARRVRDLRKQHGLTLEDLAESSGVSRSMISLIEREETSPTAAVLNKLVAALGTSMAALFADDERDSVEQPLARLAEQPVWTDPDSGYVRRQLSPTAFATPIDLVEVQFPGSQTVTFDGMNRRSVTHQQLWLLEGEMEITVDAKTWRLRAGDCLAMTLGPRIVFRNPKRQRARYLLALTQPEPPTRRAR